jgi:hypothetical protein
VRWRPVDNVSFGQGGVFFEINSFDILITLNEQAAASRRDDSELIDNVGRYTKGQLSLFHVKIARDCMIANEFWGVPNSTAPWSLWKINSLLARKAISAGWKSKTLPPFRPTYELILQLALPANILNGFHIFCPKPHWRSGYAMSKTMRMYHRSPRRSIWNCALLGMFLTFTNFLVTRGTSLSRIFSYSTATRLSYGHSSIPSNEGTLEVSSTS